MSNDIEKFKSFIPGFVMGFTRSIISHPFELLKLKSQLNIDKNKYKNLFKGLHLSILSNSIERGFQFYYFENNKNKNNLLFTSLQASVATSFFSLPYNIFLLKNIVLKQKIIFNKNIFVKSLGLEYIRNFIGSTLFLYLYNTFKDFKMPTYFSAISTSVSIWIITYPIDNIKNQIISENKIKYNFNFLYKGIKYPIIRSIPSSTIGMYIYEYVKEKINNQHI